MNNILKPALGSQLQLGHSLTEGLVGCWLMNEGSGNIINDLSGNRNVGIVDSGSPAWQPSSMGPSLEFVSGSDRVNCGKKPMLNNLAELSIVAWCSPQSNVVAQSSVTKNNLSYCDIYFSQIAYDDFRFVRGFSETNSYARTSALAVVGDGKIHQFVGMIDSSKIPYLYVDGIEQSYASQITGVGNLTDDSAGDWYIGNDVALGTDFVGKIAIVMIFNRFLSASEIAQLYREPFCMFERDPIELWAAATIGGAPPAGNPWNYYAQA